MKEKRSLMLFIIGSMWDFDCKFSIIDYDLKEGYYRSQKVIYFFEL
jgi:hypothetical protein